MEDVEVVVHRIKNHKKFEPAFLLYSWPSMRLHEDASRWIARLGRRRSLTHQRNIAYALAYWHTYCLSAGIEYRRVCVDDFLKYGDALGSVVSEKTGRPLSVDTIGQRMGALIGYYVSGEETRWYLTALDLKHALVKAAKGNLAGLEHHAQPIDASSSSLIPKGARAETDIKPLTPNELILMLDHLGPSEGEVSRGRRLHRDRIIAEWMAYVGLRLSEIVGAEKHQGLSVNEIVQLKPDPSKPFDHSIVRVLGKSAKYRNVAVPNWLVLKTKAYITGERAAAVADLKSPSSKLFVADRSAGAAFRGKPITGRCVGAG